MSPKSVLLMSVVMSSAIAGCASTEDVRALRRPELPRTQIALADSGSPAFRNIAMYEVLGAPEFRFIDGETDTAIITTRPTREEVTNTFEQWMGDADLLAPGLGDSRFLLNVTFEHLRGPDVIPFTDKHAEAVVRFELVERVSRRVVFEHTYAAELNVRMPGVTPEMGRAAFFSGIDGLAIGYSSNDAEVSGLSNAEAGFAGQVLGAIVGMVAAAPRGQRPEHWDSAETMGSFWGTERRQAAVEGMLRQSFAQFLFDLEEIGWLNMREAVTCAALNPYGLRGPAILRTTPTSVAYDCPPTTTEYVRREPRDRRFPD